MTERKTLFMSFFVPLLLLLLMYFLYYKSIVSGNFIYNSFLAWLLTTINFSIGILSIKIGLKASHKKFIISILGGVIVRLIFMVITVFLTLKFLEISINSFIFLILFFYVLYLILEIFYITKKVVIKK